MGQPVHSSRAYRFGVYELGVESQELRKFGLRIRLTGQAFQILVTLLEHPGSVVTRDELRQMLWPGEPWGDHDQRLNKAINKIRDALNDSAESPRYIETVPRVGYRFVFPVEAIAAEPREVLAATAAAAPSQVEPPPVVLPPAPPVVEPTPPLPVAERPRWLWPVTGIGLLVVAALGFVLYGSSRKIAPPETLIPTPLSTFVGIEQQPSFAPDGLEVVFSWEGEQQDNFDLYIGRAGEGGARRLTRDPARDSNPVWSPDGAWIAFRRAGEGGQSQIAIIHPDGSGERRIAETTGAEAQQDALTWTADSKNLIFADSAGGRESALYAVAIASGERKRLSSPPAKLHGDLSPSVSPDGRRLLFTRDNSMHVRELFLADLSPDLRLAGDLVQITTLQLRVDTSAWMPGGNEVIFAAAAPAGGLNYLYRIDLRTRQVRDLSNVRLQGSHPAVTAASGPKLAFSQRTIEQTSIWRIDVPASPQQEPKRTRLISSTSRDYSPDISPDGRRVVMSSIRSGGPQLWLFNVDGSDPRQVTSLGANGASIPRWSPDGTKIVFDSHPNSSTRLFTLDVGSGRVEEVKTGPGTATRGSWSRDGRYIYFHRIDSPDATPLLRVPAAGGQPEQVTAGSASYAVEDPTGKVLYYTSVTEPGGAIRRLDLQTGEDRELVRNVLGAGALSYGQGKLYFMRPPGNGLKTTLWSYDVNTGDTRHILTFDKPVHRALTISPDGRFLAVTQVDRQDNDLMIVSRIR